MHRVRTPNGTAGLGKKYVASIRSQTVKLPLKRVPKKPDAETIERDGISPQQRLKLKVQKNLEGCESHMEYAFATIAGIDRQLDSIETEGVKVEGAEMHRAEHAASKPITMHGMKQTKLESAPIAAEREKSASKHRSDTLHWK